MLRRIITKDEFKKWNTFHLMPCDINEKFHTIRANYGLWEKRFEEIEAGRACMSIRFWSGIPRRSKQVEVIQLNREHGIGLQKLKFEKDEYGYPSIKLYTVDGKYASTIRRIAKNDGLSYDDWSEWFKGYKLDEPLAIIHFTKIRY